jgi:hypothetical protein
MSRGILNVCFLAGCLLLACLSAAAQQVIHALVGTVSSVDSTAKTITIVTDDGSEDRFNEMLNSRGKIVFDKSARTDAAAAAAFMKTGEHVLVYYFGFGIQRTVVALRSLGPGPFITSAGTVVGLDRKAHALSIKDQSGQVESFQIASDAAVDTSMGAEGAVDFRPAKNDSVRVTAAVVNGNKTAVFISALAAQ